MELEPQKNFYDNRRYFQGKDNPTDTQPKGGVDRPPMSQLLFGVLFLAFIGFLAWLRIHDEGPSAKKILSVPPKAATAATKK